MKPEKEIINYILLRSFELVPNENRLTPRKVNSLIDSIDDREILATISDFCILEGKGFKKLARKATLKACRKNSAASFYTLAQEINDPRESFRLYKKGAMAGDPWSALNTGWCYFNGDGVRKNTRKAQQFYKIAANKNIAAAYYNLGLMAELQQEKVKLFKKAAKLGHPRSMLLLAKIYLKREKKISERTKALLVASHRLGEIEAGDILRTKSRILKAISSYTE